MKRKRSDRKKKMTLGSGGRFASLVRKLSRRKGLREVQDPRALASWLARKKYGKRALQKMAAMGRWRKKSKALGAHRRKAANPPIGYVTMALAGAAAYLLYKYVFAKKA